MKHSRVSTDVLVAAYESGLPLTGIAKIYRVAASTASKRLKAAGVAVARPGPRAYTLPAPPAPAPCAPPEPQPESIALEVGVAPWSCAVCGSDVFAASLRWPDRCIRCAACGGA